MKTSFVALMLAGFVGATALSIAAPALAQTKTVKACEDEWKANKAANQAAKITEKAYVEKCRAASGGGATKSEASKPTATKSEVAKPAAAKPAAAKSAKSESGKTVKACEDEWKANKAANQAAKITEKAYVEKCRAGAATAAPAAAPAKPAAAAPAKTTTAPAKTAPAKTAPAKTAAPGTGKPAGANQFATEAQAKARCASGTVVWANLESKIYHFAGHEDYGHTKSGAYMCEQDATAQGMRAAKNEKHP
jgi:hypothetical protein